LTISAASKFEGISMKQIGIGNKKLNDFNNKSHNLYIIIKIRRKIRK